MKSINTQRIQRTGGFVRKTVRCESQDRISYLPKKAIDIILEVLPIRDAVRTSVLSRKWQYRWANVGQLVFDSQFFNSLDNNFSSDSQQLKNIINKLLLLHIGSIRKFTLYMPKFFSVVDYDLSQWLLFLSRNGIKELTLHYSDLLHNCKLGLQLFSCLELTHLNLYNHVLSTPCSFEGFPNLTTLELCHVYRIDRGLKIISGCPLLKKLFMEWCSGIDNLIIPALNLTYLHIKKFVGLKALRLNSAVKVLTLSISLLDTQYEKRFEKLVLGDHIFELLVVGGVPNRLSTTLDNLKNILFEIDFNDVAHISCTLCMIRSSPNLSLLEIKGLKNSRSTIIQDLTFMEDDFDHNCSLTQLRAVKLKCFKALKTEMVLIMFLLAHSPLLEKMFIVPDKGINKDASFVVCKELMQFGRASPKAAIIYLDPGSPFP